MLPPETEEDALLLINIMTGYYRNAIDQWQEDDDFYEGDLENLIEVPEGHEISIPTTGRAIVDEAVDNVEPYEISVNYPARGFGEQAQKEAESISRGLNAMWESWRSSNYDIDIIRDFQKNAFKNGKAIFKVVPDWSLWPTLSDQEESALLETGGKPAVKERAMAIKQLRDSNFPIVCRSLSPRHVMEDPSMDARKLWVIEQYLISIAEIKNRFAEYAPEFQEIAESNFTCRELWTATWIDWNGKFHQGWHWIFINETRVKKEKNVYHNVPYVIKHSGFGTETYDAKPEKKAVGFLTKQVKSQLKAEMRRVTAFDALMQQLAFPLVILPDTLEDLTFDTAPGAINFVPEELMAMTEKIFLSAKLPDGAYLQSIGMIQNQIERATTQRAVRGAGVPGTDSAAQLGMITAQAKLRLEPIKRATEEAVDQVNSLVLYYIENIFKKPVSVFGTERAGPSAYTIKPASIKGRYRTKTTFKPSDEQEKERKLVLATDAMSKAKLNPYDALTIAGFDNAMEIIARNLAYSIMEEPAIKRQLAKKALEDWGLDSQELQLEEIADNNMLQQMVAQLQQRQQGMGGQPGTPLAGEGGGPPNGQQPQPSAAPPQAIGAPAQMAPQSPQAQQGARTAGNPLG